MKRRGFLGSLVALVCAPFVPTAKPARPRLTFHPDAFALALKPLRVGETIAVRMPKGWTAKDSLQPHLHDAMVKFDMTRVL